MKADRRRRDTRELVNSLRLLQGAAQRQSREFVRKYRITGQQLGALRIVTLSPRISLSELSERMFLHTSTMSGIVDRLERRGYVVRERTDPDRRVVHLRVTASGKQVIKRTPLAGMGLLIHAADTMPAEQVSHILRGLRLLLGVMRIQVSNDRYGKRQETKRT